MDFVTDKEVVFLKYPCYICGDSYAQGPTTISHIASVHKKSLPRRRPGIKRPYNQNYTYQSDMKMGYDLSHHGCCSCWFHSGDYEKLQEHVEREHAPDDATYNKETGSDISKNEKAITSHTSKQVQFEDGNDAEQDDKPYDKAVASNIAQQIVDLGNMLTKILKM